MEYKAEYIGAYTDRYDKRYTTLFYRYRGREYQVVKANNWGACSSDYTMKGGSMTLSKQHKEAQEMIDNMVDNPSDFKPVAQKYEGSAQEGLDMFFNYINGGYEHEES